MNHNLIRVARLHWLYCCKCGAVGLNNERSKKLLRKPCPGA